MNKKQHKRELLVTFFSHVPVKKKVSYKAIVKNRILKTLSVLSF